MGTRFLSLTAFSISDGTSDCRTSPLISSANRRRISVAGALPGRKPGTRAMRANSRATFSTAFWTVSAGTSRSSSRRQLASAMVVVVKAARKHVESVRPFAFMRLRKEDREERAQRGRGSIGYGPDRVNAGSLLVRKEGVEPPRPRGHRILSPARLPVPPLPHGPPKDSTLTPYCRRRTRFEAAKAPALGEVRTLARTCSRRPKRAHQFP